MKRVYTCFCTDVIHEGHLNIIKEAQKLGEVTVGVLTDTEMIKYKRFPLKSTEERVELCRQIPGVSNVIIQSQIMYDDVVKELHPDYIIHGNNWDDEAMLAIKENIEGLLDQYGGELVEVPYTYNEKVAKLDKQMREKLAMPEHRRGRLRKLLNLGVTVADGAEINQFDAMWISSLCDSTDKGKPDIELVDMTSRFRTIEDVTEVTTKPIIFDGDTGGMTEHFVYTVRSLERLGVSAVIIEDKTGLKKNSLFGTEVEQTQDSVENFSAKIAAGKRAQLSDDFMIIARIESLILGKGMDDALTRAFAFRDAGADGIMIHSRKKDPAEILEFCDKFREVDKTTPIVVVPTSFNVITEAELAEHGVNIVIYANQLMRAAFPAMEGAAKSILKHHRAKEIDSELMPIKNIITLIDEI